MKQKCIIVDDEKRARNILKTYILDLTSLELVGEFKNAIEALEYLNLNKVDIIFLDIEMPKLTGLNLASLLNDDVNVIFTTAHREFAVEGFELEAIDYLLKPFSFERFLKSIKKIQQYHSDSQNSPVKDYSYFKVDKVMVKVNYSDLLFIQGLSNYVKIYTKNDTKITYNKLSDLEKTLPKGFVRLHKSYIINLTKIKSYTKEYVIINDKHIPIGITYRKSFFEQMSTIS